MPLEVPEDLGRTIETLYRTESGRILATLVRLLGDLDLAEEAMHEAFAAALETWPRTGERHWSNARKSQHKYVEGEGWDVKGSRGGIWSFVGRFQRWYRTEPGQSTG
jgi:hypothetical protein